MSNFFVYALAVHSFREFLKSRIERLTSFLRQFKQQNRSQGLYQRAAVKVDKEGVVTSSPVDRRSQTRELANDIQVM
jgi:hypothetical protein